MRAPIDSTIDSAELTKMKVAYVMSRFPKLTETFVLNEIMEQERIGAVISIFPLLRERQPVRHPEVDELVSRAHYSPFISFQALRANWHYFRASPRRYAAALFEALSGTIGSANFFFGAVGILPKAVLFARTMEENGVEHIHAHFANHPALAALVIHRLTDIPFSFTAHGTDLHRDQRMLETKVAASSFTVTVSNYNKEFIAQRCGESTRAKVEVVRCGVDTDYFRPRGGVRSPGPFRLVCIASFLEVKGHQYLIQACKRLADEGVDFECHLIGDGPLRSKVERQIAECGLDGRVHIRGPLPRPAVRDMLCSSEAAVLTSVPTRSGQREGVPVALMEAMACGRPVVASRMSGIPELVESGVSGLLVDPGDTAAICDALRQLATNPELVSELGRAARQKILKEFDLATNTARLARLFSRADRISQPEMLEAS